jgi:hypothetical protein
VADGRKTGGRAKGTPNKATAKLKTFLDGVFTEALECPEFRTRLVAAITNLELDPKVLALLLAYWAGAPPKEHKHSGTVGLALERLVAGDVDGAEEDDQE